jgi:hypothetical protein
MSIVADLDTPQVRHLIVFTMKVGYLCHLLILNLYQNTWQWHAVYLINPIGGGDKEKGFVSYNIDNRGQYYKWLRIGNVMFRSKLVFFLLSATHTSLGKHTNLLRNPYIMNP